MTDTGYTRSPKVVKGALVQLVEEIVGITPRIIPFQYNPESLSRTLTPWNPFEVSETNRGQFAPTAQPYDPKEHISVQIDLDASDQMGDNDGTANTFGVADRIAAIEKLLLPTPGIAGELLAVAATVASAIGGTAVPSQRPSVSVCLFVWGPGRILPVRLTSYSIEEQQFLPSLYPFQAKISLGMEVLTPDVFSCPDSAAELAAIAVYRFFRLQQESLAAEFVARNGSASLSLLPL